MCTGIRFNDASGKMFFGRNLDWSQGYGEQVVVTPTAAPVPAAFDRPNDPAPGAGHTVMGMAIIFQGIPLYFDCGNDAGLAVAGLNFPQSAHYAAEPQAGATNVAAYEFPFWIARSFATLDEVREALKDVTIVAKAVNEHLPVASLHWIIGDATGSIVVECMEDGMRVWENGVDVLTNEPNFGWHRQNLRNYLTLSEDEPAHVAWGAAKLAPFGSGMGMQGIPGDYSGRCALREGRVREQPLPDAGGRGGERHAAFPYAGFGRRARGLGAHGGRVVRKNALHELLFCRIAHVLPCRVR